jgi:F420-non-reducing hydrogenase large subunit
MGNFVESHALAIAALSLPDLLFHKNGPQERNLAFLLKQREFLVRRAMKLRQAGSLITKFAGKREIHPISPVIGGVLQTLKTEERDEIATMMEGAKDTVSAMWQLIWETLHDNEDIALLGETRSAFLSMKGREGVELYDADLAIMSGDGEIIKEFPSSNYLDFIDEEERDFSYMKFPVLKDGTKFRVGPLARLNICRMFSTPNSQKMMDEITSAYALPLQNSMLYHLARVAETMYALERAEQLLNDEDLLSDKVKPDVCRAKEGRGIGIIEAPRGTLVHIYDIDSNGYAKNIGLYVATQHNNFAINDALTKTAKQILIGPAPEETTLNKLEMIIRAYDPCLSCATHTIGQRGFRINLRQQDGSLIKRWE